MAAAIGGGRRVLALVGGEAEPGGASRRKGGAVRRRIDPELGRVHADADDAIHAGGTRTSQLGEPLDQLETRGGPEGPVDVGDQETRDAGFGLGGGDPLVRPPTMAARSWPPARCRAGVKKDSRWTTPWAAPSTTLS